jgi:hypothetical protein
MTKKTETKEKQYSLKDIELRVVGNINTRANAEMLDFLAFVAIERLAYEVTENTTFSVRDGNLYIGESVPEEAEPEVAVA